MMFRHVAFACLCFLTLASVQVVSGDRFSQAVSPTPVPVSIPSPLPFVATPEAQVTSTQTRTPTPVGSALLEAISEANVRAEADPEAELLGTIRAGDLYPIIGRYFRWIEFQYDQTRIGWVFDELVTIIGDESLIKDLTQNVTPTPDTVSLNATETALAVLLPGEGALALPVFPAQDSSQPLASTPPDANVILPTFTFPPSVLLIPTNSSEATDSLLANDGNAQNAPLQRTLPGSIPPFVPTLILGGTGIIGLWISTALRRK